MKDEWATQEKVFQAETGRHSSEIKQVPLKWAKRASWLHVLCEEML